MATRRPRPTRPFWPDVGLVRGERARSRYDWVKRLDVQRGYCDVDLITRITLANPAFSPFSNLIETDVERVNYKYHRLKIRNALRSVKNVINGDSTPGATYRTLAMIIDENGDRRVVPMPYAAHEERLRSQLIARATRQIAGWEAFRRQVLALQRHMTGPNRHLRLTARPVPEYPIVPLPPQGGNRRGPEQPSPTH